MTARLDVSGQGMVSAEGAAVIELVLPRLAGTREAVGDLMAEQDVPEDLSGKVLVVHCRDLASGSPSFADQLVKTALTERRAAELVLLGAPARFVQHVRESAQRRQVDRRIGTSLEAGASA